MNTILEYVKQPGNITEVLDKNRLTLGLIKEDGKTFSATTAGYDWSFEQIEDLMLSMSLIETLSKQ